MTTSKTNTPLIGKGICEHPTIKKVSFTGSTPVGKIILSNCASTVKKVQLELGGKYFNSISVKYNLRQFWIKGNAPFIVFDSADLKKAVAGLIA